MTTTDRMSRGHYLDRPAKGLAAKGLAALLLAALPTLAGATCPEYGCSARFTPGESGSRYLIEGHAVFPSSWYGERPPATEAVVSADGREVQQIRVAWKRVAYQQLCPSEWRGSYAAPAGFVVEADARYTVSLVQNVQNVVSMQVRLGDAPPSPPPPPEVALCHSDLEVPAPPMPATPMVVAGSDPVDVLDAWLERGRLRIEVGYSGGCAEHQLTLVATPDFRAGGMPKVLVEVRHFAAGDPCDGYLQRTLDADLTPLEQALRAVDGRESDEILIRVEGLEVLLVHEF